jgi:hypothetical protein
MVAGLAVVGKRKDKCDAGKQRATKGKAADPWTDPPHTVCFPRFSEALLLHLINSVFPDNEDRAHLEKGLKLRLFSQNPFVLLAAAR